MRLCSVLLLLISLGSLASCSPMNEVVNKKSVRPNILLVVVDDLGYSDLGAFGGEIKTPSLDRFAYEGLRLSSAYAAPTCSPTRAMLMTGADHHLVGLGAMAEHILPAQKGQPGYEGGLNKRAVTIATRLRDNGYYTLMSGKWHLGMRPESGPLAHGFQRSFALLEGGASHFNNAGLFPFQATVHHIENGQPATWPGGQYSSDVYTQKLINYIGERDGDQPFFAYLSLTAPHWPLQAPDNLIDKYRGQYDAGWDVLRRERMDKMVDLGLIEEVGEVVHPPEYRAWTSLSGEEKVVAAKEMEVFAAMVDGVDLNIAKLRSYLEDADLLDNTIVIFMSDNGAEGTEYDKLPWMKEFIANNFDNSLENLGRVNSYVMYSPNWAHASSAPSRLFKGHSAEGGIKVPAWIWRKGIKTKGGVSREPVTVRDLAQTILDVAGVEVKGGQYRGRAVAPMTGKALTPLLDSPNEKIHGDSEVFAGELYGNRGLRQGKWKILWELPPYGKGSWALYDLEVDPMESVDLSARYPAIVESLATKWKQYAKESGVVVLQ